MGVFCEGNRNFTKTVINLTIKVQEEHRSVDSTFGMTLLFISCNNGSASSRNSTHSETYQFIRWRCLKYLVIRNTYTCFCEWLFEPGERRDRCPFSNSSRKCPAAQNCLRAHAPAAARLVPHGGRPRPPRPLRPRNCQPVLLRLCRSSAST